MTKRADDWLNEGHAFYVKLHGSQNWRSADGSGAMVIGRAKELQIGSEPLLEWYFQLFQHLLYQPEGRILIIGYGFRDEHVNRVLARAAEDFGLRLHVMAPGSPQDFLSSVRKAPCGDVIVDSLGGMYPYTLADLFPPDQSKTEPARELFDGFLGTV